MRSGDKCPKCGGVPEELDELSAKIREFHPATHSAFVYFLIADGVVKYVGQTLCLRGRIMNHTDSKVFERVLYIRVPRAKRIEVERYWIAKLNPAWNSKGTGKWTDYGAAIYGRTPSDRARVSDRKIELADDYNALCNRGLEAKTTNMLMKNGVDFVWQLERLSESELLSFRYCGIAAIRDIRSKFTIRTG